MFIEAIIPTLHRTEKLMKCIASLREANCLVDHNFYTYIYYSDKKEYSLGERLFDSYKWVLLRYIDKYKASTFWNNHLKNSRADISFYLNDDVIVDSPSLAIAIKAMEIYFPDLDGVIGLKQKNLPNDQVCLTAFGAIGHKFRKRFPDNQVCCPDYNRFYFDKELEEYSNSVGKLYYCEEATITHLHPAFDKTQEDSTHFDVRKYLAKDRKMYNRRKKENLLWGKNFTLLEG